MKKIPYVAYRVNVAVKGTYQMKVGYMIAGGTEANWPNHNILVYVNGQAWTPNVTGSPYQAKRIMQTHVNTLNNYGTNKLNSVKIFNDQMPVGIQLNNGNLALACETKSYNETTKKDCYKISVGISTDKHCI